MWILYIHVFVIAYYCLDMLTLADYIRHWVYYKRLTHFEKKKKKKEKKKGGGGGGVLSNEQLC